MIKVNTNIEVVTANILKKFEALRDPKPLVRFVAVDILSLVTERIHQDGKAADDSQIGTYSSGYLKLRKGKFKRGGSTKIIVSLTSELENDWGVIGTERGWGIGFIKNESKTGVSSLQKMRFVEKGKNKKIASLSKSEKEYAITKLTKLIKDAIS